MYDFSFPKKLRLLKFNKNLFFTKSNNIIFNNYLYIYNKINFLLYPRIGFLINKKIIKLSCKRNYIKRVIRESFRLNKNKILNKDYLIYFNKNLNLYISNLNLHLNKLWFLFKNY